MAAAVASQRVMASACRGPARCLAALRSYHSRPTGAPFSTPCHGYMMRHAVSTNYHSPADLSFVVKSKLSGGRRYSGVPQSTSAQAEATANNGTLGLPEGEVPRWEVRMLFDGDCPLCMREVDMLRGMDEGKGKIDFVDISAPDYDPSKNMGLEFETVMATIHAILPDGTVVTGVEVFRRLYEAVGLGWVYAVTKNPTVGALAERVYNFWARYRMQVTGRPALEVILSKRKTCRDTPQDTKASK